MAEAHPGGGLGNFDDFPGGEMIRAGGPAAVSGGPAVKATLVALVRDRNAEVVDRPAKRIHG